MQAGVGKASFPEDKLVQNIKAFADAVQKAKPAGAKGHLHQARGDFLDHGPRRESRSGKPVWGRLELNSTAQSLSQARR